MATYVVGDIQGCFEPFQRLLATIQYDPTRDQIWLTGDLVNRGPESLDVLRWAKNQGCQVTTVLGNHDLHLLACQLGVVQQRQKDTLQDILNASDCDELMHWLRQQPLLYRKGNDVLVHAALHASWTIEEAESLARELESLLQGPKAQELLAASYQEQHIDWNTNLSPSERRVSALVIFTRLRCVSRSGSLTFDYHGPLNTLPIERIPWWRIATERPKKYRIFFGHWSSIGLHEEDVVISLDSGCVWGRSLTAYRLNDGMTFQVPANPSS